MNQAGDLQSALQLHNTSSSAHPDLEERLTKLANAGRALCFSNYQAMLAAITADQPLCPGQTIYIETSGCPDVWISSNDNAFLGAYSYTSDAQMIQDLKNTGSIIHRGHMIRPIKAV